MPLLRAIRVGLLILCCVVSARRAAADEVRVAVASNFAQPMRVLAERFEQRTGHRAILVLGATGKLSAQIEHGAPYELLLAADRETPARLEKAGFAVPGSRFTYALGKLVLYSARPGLVDAAGRVLEKGEFRHLALANPALAPYGAAAIATLRGLRVFDGLRKKLVQAENIAQAFEFVQSGNAELGFVALSQVLSLKGAVGSYWLVPEALYPPIFQDAVVLRKGAANPAARELAAFLTTESSRQLIAASGYALPDPAASARTSASGRP